MQVEAAGADGSDPQALTERLQRQQPDMRHPSKQGHVSTTVLTKWGYVQALD
jgi:hypothetical protein